MSPIIIVSDNNTAWPLDDQWTAVVLASGLDAKGILDEAQADGLDAHDALLYLAARAAEVMPLAAVLPLPKIVIVSLASLN